jgi:anaerobic magnesium-protoporphyrin IX monomethyl ester cyclase
MMSTRDHGPILLAHSYYLRYDPKQVGKMRPYPPLATLIVAALLRERGYGVHLFDAMLADGVEEFVDCLDRVRPPVVAIVEDNFNFLTKMCTTRMREAALEMIRASRDRGARVVVNGSDATDHPELYLGAGADAVIMGEPEDTLVELLEAWNGNGHGALPDIAGLSLPGSGNGPRRTPARPFVTNLDALPFPAWDLVDTDRYRSAWTAAHGRLSWNMVTSRGCPYHCNWCAKPLFGTRYAQRSAANVAEELRRLRDEVAPDHVWFADDIFGLTAQWIEDVAREVTARGARTPFTMQSRVNLMKPRVVAALAEAGAEEVWLGVESGSQRILDAMDKGTKIEQVRAATRNLRAGGIRACWFIQLGYLGEQWDDALRTRDLIREERPDDIGVSVSYPLPGTKFYQMVRAQLDVKRNWDDSDDLAMMFRGTYSSAFYRMIRELLHDEVRSPGARTSEFRQALDARWAALERRETESGATA